jgi:hypothetical protein
MHRSHAFGQVEGDVDDHVFLAADVAGLAGALQDGVSGDAIALGGAFGVQQEAGVDAGVALDDRGPVGRSRPSRPVAPRNSSSGGAEAS